MPDARQIDCCSSHMKHILVRILLVPVVQPSCAPAQRGAVLQVEAARAEGVKHAGVDRQRACA